MKKCLILSFVFILSLSSNIKGQHYTDWEGFEFDTLRPETGNIDAGVYELKKDYTISLPEFFNDQSKMPSKKGQIKDTYRGNAEFYRNWASNLPVVEWDFIRIENGGILTIKKGYRWDGSSNPIEEMEYFSYRSSLVHDVLYDLMRMNYLKPDKHHNVPIFVPVIGWTSLDTHILWDSGDYNRAMADIIHFMIAWDDGDSKKGAFKDFKVLRKGGAYNSHNSELLYSWKFHVSELAAYATDGKVELKWKRADEAGKNPNNELTDKYDILRNGQKIATVDRWMSTYYTDTDVSNNGSTYTYQIKESMENTDLYDWSNVKYAVPLNGAGNALKLDGINDYMEANTTSNDLCYENLFPAHETTMEAWVKPESQTGKSAILALNTISGGNYNILMYDGDSQQFCYYDDNTSYVFTPDVFPVNNWYHVAVTFEYKFSFTTGFIRTGTLYVNGREQVNFTPLNFPSHGARFSIGQEWDGNSPTNFFKGCIDEVRIWKEVKTQAELKANRSKALRGDEESLVALWHFNEPANATWFYTDDATVNDNIGRLHGYASTETPFVPSGAMNTQPILFGVPANITVECDAVPPPAEVMAEDINGNALEVVFIETITDGSCENSYTMLRTWTATDDENNTISATQSITVTDTTAPVITGVSEEPIYLNNDEASCGAIVEYPEIAASDNCSELVDLNIDHVPGTHLPVGTNTVTVSATDDCGNTKTAFFDVIVTNKAPVIENISASSVFFPRHGDILFATASYADNNLSEAIWDWGDGTTSPGTINGQTISGEHRYQINDDYIITLTITDLCGKTSTKQYILTNNADRAFVTGDGWFKSPENAFRFDDMQDEAKFKFECRYNMYGETLRGKTIFSFNQDEYVFKSSSYNNLIISEDKAVFRGSGSINRKTGFGFMISVIDGDLYDNNDEDRFRIKIWDETNGIIIYDNEWGKDEELDATTIIGGGEIIIHNTENENNSNNHTNTKISNAIGVQKANEDQMFNEVSDDMVIKIYPNPFSLSTEIKYSNPNHEKVDIRIYDMSGRIVKTFMNKASQIGWQKVVWDGKNENGVLVNNGIYFCRMVIGNHNETFKIIYEK